jgi:hypothetical protein
MALMDDGIHDKQEIDSLLHASSSGRDVDVLVESDTDQL